MSFKTRHACGYLVIKRPGVRRRLHRSHLVVCIDFNEHYTSSSCNPQVRNPVETRSGPPLHTVTNCRCVFVKRLTYTHQRQRGSLSFLNARVDQVGIEPTSRILSVRLSGRLTYEYVIPFSTQLYLRQLRVDELSPHLNLVNEVW